MNDYPFDVVACKKKVRNSRIRIGADCIVYVTAPDGADIDKIIRLREEWILKKIDEIKNLASPFEGSDGSFLYDGKMWHPVFSKSGDVDFIWPDMFYSSVSGLKTGIKAALREDLSIRADHFSGIMNVDFGRIAIRNQRTRWASCSGKGNLNFNIRSMALPGDLRDYLVVHELAHRIEMNHSAAFWNVVSKYYSGYAGAEKDLRAFWLATGRNRIWKTLLE